MPTEFQRMMDATLAGIANTFAFIDDILIVTRGDKISKSYMGQEGIWD